jgi:hypothetical protein
MLCDKCGTEIQTEWQFCKKCGVSISITTQTTRPAKTKPREKIVVLDDAEIHLEYNPVDESTALSCNGKTIELSCIGTGKNIKLQSYIDEFFPALQRRLRLGKGSSRKMSFYGTLDDFTIVSTAYRQYVAQKENHGVELTLNFISRDFADGEL